MIIVLSVIFSGTRVERDFVEAPSQMLENWCWETEPLKKMSGHYEGKLIAFEDVVMNMCLFCLDGSSLPDDMIKTLVASRNANAGLLNMRQVCVSQ